MSEVVEEEENHTQQHTINIEHKKREDRVYTKKNGTHTYIHTRSTAQHSRKILPRGTTVHA